MHDSPFPRATGLLIIEAVASNPNGDPDMESDPRQLDAQRRGLITPVSFKRKVRDVVGDGVVRDAAFTALGLTKPDQYDILEKRGRDRDSILKLDPDVFRATYWDGRVFGNTFLEESNDKKKAEGEGDADAKPAKGKAGKKDGPSRDRFISPGVVQFGPGISIAPVTVTRLTMTNKAGVEGDKDRGMAPLASRFVEHGLYAMPFFVNPGAAKKSGCSALDIDLMCFAIPHAYAQTASAARPDVRLLHAWYAVHTSALGSVPDAAIIRALTPKKKADPETASTSIDDYEIPTELPQDIRARLARFEDLCVKDWTQGR